MDGIIIKWERMIHTYYAGQENDIKVCMLHTFFVEKCFKIF